MLIVNITQRYNPFVSQSLGLSSLNFTPTEKKNKVFTSEKSTSQVCHLNLWHTTNRWCI